MQSEREEIKKTQPERASAKGPRLPHKYAKRDEKGELATVAWSSTRPDAGRFIADAIHTGQVLYGMTGELKKKKKKRKNTNGAREWKMSYIQ